MQMFEGCNKRSLKLQAQCWRHLNAQNINTRKYHFILTKVFDVYKKIVERSVIRTMMMRHIEREENDEGMGQHHGGWQLVKRY